MTQHYEAEIAMGLASIAENEIKQIIKDEGKVLAQHRPQEIPFTYAGDLTNLLGLGTVSAIYQTITFQIPRPKALLGHQNFTKLLGSIQNIVNIYVEKSFQSLYIGAAGSESSVMTRIKNELAEALRLKVGADEGDLYLRIRPTPDVRESWDVLIRVTPRPLSTRAWRSCDMEGALNGAVANAMVHLTNPTPQDTFLNIACGSGTIMIERLAVAQAKRVIGCDINPEALACARNNIEQSGDMNNTELLLSDATILPLPDNSVDVLCADLPFGQLVGSHEENEWLYPAIMAEAARVAQPQARFVVITHEVSLMEETLASFSVWQVQHVQMITLSGLHPRIYVLERSNI